MASISGSVTVAGDPDDWIACAFDANTHAFAGVAAVSAGAYEITGLTAGQAYVVACRPKSGGAWTGSTGFALNGYCIPDDPVTTPYLFKATAVPDGDDAFDDVALLLHCDGADQATTFSDSSGNSLSVTRYGNAQIDTDNKKYGTASALFDGSGDYLSASHASLAIANSGTFTLECWLNAASLPATKAGVFFNGDPTSNNSRAQVEVNPSGTISVYLQEGTGSGVTVTTTGAVSTDTWHHLAVCLDATAIKIFIDGVQSGSGSYSTTITANNNFYIGITRSGGLNYYFNGNMDEIRITNGTARYSSNFTPLARAFPNSAAAIGYTASTEPTWPTDPSGTVIDNDVTWTNMGQFVRPLMHGPLIAA